MYINYITIKMLVQLHLPFFRLFTPLKYLREEGKKAILLTNEAGED